MANQTRRFDTSLPRPKCVGETAPAPRKAPSFGSSRRRGSYPNCFLAQRDGVDCGTWYPLEQTVGSTMLLDEKTLLWGKSRCVDVPVLAGMQISETRVESRIYQS